MDQVTTRSQIQGSQQANKVGVHENPKCHINQSEGRKNIQSHKGDKDMNTQCKKEGIKDEDQEKNGEEISMIMVDNERSLKKGRQRV